MTRRSAFTPLLSIFALSFSAKEKAAEVTIKRDPGGLTHSVYWTDSKGQWHQVLNAPLGTALTIARNVLIGDLV